MPPVHAGRAARGEQRRRRREMERERAEEMRAERRLFCL